MIRYRIVRDRYLGYEVQVRHWWFPFWVQLGGSNTSTTLERAQEYLSQRKNLVVYTE